MSELRMVPPPLGDAAPRGDLRFLWFDGILAGPRLDLAVLDAFVQRIDALRIGPLDVHIEGGRVTLLPCAEPVSGPALAATKDAFEREIAALAARFPPHSTVESTLRCTEVFDGSTRETLYGFVGGEMQVVSRARARTDSDLARAPGTVGRAGRPEKSLARRAALAVLGVAALVLVAWQSGIWDRFFAAPPESLVREAGLFGPELELRVAGAGGDYRVEVGRGPGWPRTADAFRAMTANASTPLERAKAAILAQGGDIFVRLTDLAGHTLETRPLSLRPLLVSEDGVAEVRLNGRRAAARVELSLAG
jgi:hypothetical protein